MSLSPRGDGESVANRPNVVVEGDEVRYRASSLGSCTRALAAARQELEPFKGPLPERVAEVFERGHRDEEKGRKWFQDRGWKVWGEQKEAVVRLTGRLSIVGHIDFIIEDGEVGPTIVDVKSQSEEEFRKASIRDSAFWHKYEWQFSAYRVGLGMGMAVLRVCEGDVKLEMLEDRWLKGKAELLGRVLEVERMAAGDLGECDRDDFPCPYFKLHDTKDVIVEVVEVVDSELRDLALHYVRLGVELEPLERRRKEIRLEIIRIVESGRVRERESGIEVRVTRSEVKERVVPAGSMVRLSVKLPEEGGRPNVARSDE
jgi:hypothetical protein